MNFCTSFDSSPIVWLLLIGGVCITIYEILKLFFRWLNISKNGWPPAHCDADGERVLEENN